VAQHAAGQFIVEPGQVRVFGWFYRQLRIVQLRIDRLFDQWKFEWNVVVESDRYRINLRVEQ
jgi:hypothetical protein